MQSKSASGARLTCSLRGPQDVHVAHAAASSCAVHRAAVVPEHCTGTELGLGRPPLRYGNRPTSRLSCSRPARPQNASSLAADASKKEESGSSDATYSVDPNDPLKFFTQQDNTFTDGVQLALVLAVLYTVVQVLKLANGVK
jgi:hypothetical protein